MVLEPRLMEAKRLLRFTTLSLSQIAYELGFHDSAHFPRFFKTREGEAPIAWRKSRSSPGGKGQPPSDPND